MNQVCGVQPQDYQHNKVIRQTTVLVSSQKILGIQDYRQAYQQTWLTRFLYLFKDSGKCWKCLRRPNSKIHTLCIIVHSNCMNLNIILNDRFILQYKVPKLYEHFPYRKPGRFLTINVCTKEHSRFMMNLKQPPGCYNTLKYGFCRRPTKKRQTNMFYSAHTSIHATYLVQSSRHSVTEY